MSLIVASRMCHVQKSLIREIAEKANRPGMITFANGNPGAETFQHGKIREITSKVLSRNPTTMLMYGNTLGYEPLRLALKEYLSGKWGIDFSKNEIMITTGGQQDCDIATKVLLEENEAVVSEEPSFSSCFNTFYAYNGKIVGVPLDDDGMRLKDLRKTVEETPNARMIYIIPNFHNPTGYTTSREKREAIYGIAQEYRLGIFEDDPYGELRFAGSDVMPIKSIDTDGLVIYGGTFSKTLAPGIRVGYVVFDKSLEKEITVAKQTTDVHTNILSQHIAYELLTNGYDEHLDFCRNTYREKCRVMRETLAEEAPDELSWNDPEGGLFISLFFPDGTDTYDFAFKAIEKGVACVPGSAFTIDGRSPTSNLRLCYSTSNKDQIRKGVKILCDFAKEWLKKRSIT